MEGLRQDTRLVVERLEGQVASLRRSLWFLTRRLAGGLAFLLLTHRHPKVAGPSTRQVQGLTVVDGTGAARATLGSDGLHLLDAQGHERGGLLLQADGTACLSLKDVRGADLLKAAAPSQGGALALWTPGGDAVLLGTAQGPTLQLRKGGRLLLKQPYDAAELR